ALAGRTGRLRIEAAVRRAMLLGGLLGGAAGLSLLLAVLATVGPTPSLVAMGGRLLVPYGVFGGVVGLGFVARVVDVVDVRAATSIVVFGPLSLLRPAWFVGWAGWYALGEPTSTVVIAAIGVAVVLLVEQALDRVLWPHLLPDPP
ncbi:MAG: hypothetical protein KC656_19465, partial [Myxococcales bacterium]|nr:hypothetical protein [Myxococcales bacterium]